MLSIQLDFILDDLYLIGLELLFEFVQLLGILRRRLAKLFNSILNLIDCFPIGIDFAVQQLNSDIVIALTGDIVPLFVELSRPFEIAKLAVNVGNLNVEVGVVRILFQLGFQPLRFPFEAVFVGVAHMCRHRRHAVLVCLLLLMHSIPKTLGIVDFRSLDGLAGRQLPNLGGGVMIGRVNPPHIFQRGNCLREFLPRLVNLGQQPINIGVVFGRLDGGL